MSVIADVRARRQKLADVLANEEYSGIRDIVEELYPDQAHFLFELLQNAQDTSASEASFALFPEKLIFEHNGRAFNKNDVEGITNIGKGTKKSDEDTIGRFGVGFKAVFAYCETPTVYSPTFSFLIENLVLPTEVEPLADLSGRTRFEFPFNNPKKEAQTAFNEIADGLAGLKETALLFLSNLGSISWSIKDGSNGTILRIQRSQHHIEIMHQYDAIHTSSAHFLRFDQAVENLPNQSVSVAFPLQFRGEQSEFDDSKPIAKQMKIASADIGQVAVFFPAEKETSGLRFHLHAPFVPELSRASVKETAANIPLFAQLAQLCGESLFEIRDLGLLNAEFLGVLPNSQDAIPPRYAGIRDSIIKQLKEQPLTPTQDRSHAPSNILLQSKAAMKDMISDGDLEVLINYEVAAPKWAASAPQKNSNADRMLNSLNISDWDIDALLEKLEEIESDYDWQEPNLAVINWLASKSNEWLQQFYSLLFRELSHEGGFFQLTASPIIRLEDGSFAKGKGSYFPSDVGDGDGFPRVEAETYQAGKNKPRQVAARKFLEEVGVREVDETELVKSILNSRYSKRPIKHQSGDLKRFIKLVKESPATSLQFGDYYIFETEAGKWAKPAAVYLDAPLVETGLGAYYPADRQAAPYALADRYPEKGISNEQFVKFATAIGAKTRLEVKECNCHQNPDWNYLRSVAGERYTSPMNRDYAFEEFNDATGTPNLPVSKLIWATVDNKSFSPNYLCARYQKNQSSGYREAPSQLVYQLRNSAWVPQNDGEFVKPADARAELLPSGFPYDASKAWLKAIEFGLAAVKRNSVAQAQKSVARSLGFDDDDALADAQWFAGLDSEARRAFKDDMERRVSFELPANESRNPERRTAKVLEQAEADVVKQSEKRTRSVQIGLSDVKNETDQYLRRQYTNSDGEMICQACKSSLPFKLNDGSFYVEKIELVKSLDRRHYQNYLALCPNHAAMFQHVHGSEDIVRDLLLECEDENLEVILAGKDEKIYFTKTHLADIRAIIGSAAEND